MNAGTLPSRYAQAIFGYATGCRAEDQVYDDLCRLAGAFARVEALRKLAATFGPTEKLATEGQENRENYTGGSGYYLSGSYRRSGWTIRKESLKYGLPRGSQAVLDFAHWLETASR